LRNADSSLLAGREQNSRLVNHYVTVVPAPAEAERACRLVGKPMFSQKYPANPTAPGHFPQDQAQIAFDEN
jgi:hypothetical protein